MPNRSWYSDRCGDVIYCEGLKHAASAYHIFFQEEWLGVVKKTGARSDAERWRGQSNAVELSGATLRQVAESLVLDKILTPSH